MIAHDRSRPWGDPLHDLLEEAYRHDKIIADLGETGETVLTELGLDPAAAGVVVGTDPAEVVGKVGALLANHRVWERVL